MSSTQSSKQLFQDFLGKFHSRKLLNVHNPLMELQVPAAPPRLSGESSLDKNVLVVLSVLVCIVVLTLLLNFVIRCAIRSFLSASDSGNNSSPSKPISKGIKKKALRAFQIVKYSAGDDQLKVPGVDTECVICISEFSVGERVRILPKCNHGFHVRCIDKWLSSNSSCPKCRHSLIETGSSSALPSSLPVLETVIRIAPLEPEGVVVNALR